MAEDVEPRRLLVIRFGPWGASVLDDTRFWRCIRPRPVSLLLQSVVAASTRALKDCRFPEESEGFDQARGNADRSGEGSPTKAHMSLSDDRTGLLLPLTVGGATIFCTILIHAIATIGIIHLVRSARVRGIAGVHFSVDVVLVSAAAFIAFGAHFIETVVWAVVFVLCGEFVHFAPALYHSATNYTTLGYGDIILSAPWRLLGPLEAADGMLLFGLSTAILFAVIQRFVQLRFDTEQL